MAQPCSTVPRAHASGTHRIATRETAEAKKKKTAKKEKAKREKASARAKYTAALAKIESAADRLMASYEEQETALLAENARLSSELDQKYEQIAGLLAEVARLKAELRGRR